ncbi:MAG: HD domain-containing protein [Candidatus Brocadiaceae bacterium]|nr:HD domain-containing protein [Candidatus Brocadiaceae bacterium]
MRARKLRDAVHKDIYLDPGEMAALDTPQMQRLRGIRQLGAAYQVYPSAQHTRFEHCLGACWMAKRIVEQIERSGDFAFPEVHKRAVFLASLVHDVTHIPFGHTFEDERRLLDRHDHSRSRFRLLLGGGELRERLEATEEGRLALQLLEPGRAVPPRLEGLRQIVSGTICADLLDYLKRDNYFCGLSRDFDERVFHYFRIADGRLVIDLRHDGFFRRDALSEVTNLLRIRYVLSERVYYHHAKIAAGVMISKAVERALAGGLTEADLCTLTDEALLHHLGREFGGDEALRELLDGFRMRRLFKRCYMLSRQIGEDAVEDAVRRHHLNENGARDQAERRIADALGAPPHRVAIYCAPAGMALKEADVPVLVPEATLTRLSDLNSDEVQVLKRQHQALWKLYVFLSPAFADRTAEAGAACERVIGFPNELPAEKRGHLL